MKNVILLYLKTFMILVSIIGSLYLLLHIFQFGEIGLRQASLERLIFGSLGLTFLFVTTHLIFLKFIGVQLLSGVNLDVKQSQTLNTRLTLAQIAQQLKLHSDFSKLNYFQEKNEIDIDINSSWKSWGEKITIKNVTQLGDQGFIEIMSQPSFKLTVVDYGKNYHNVQQISHLISSL